LRWPLSKSRRGAPSRILGLQCNFVTWFLSTKQIIHGAFPTLWGLLPIRDLQRMWNKQGARTLADLVWGKAGWAVRLPFEKVKICSTSLALLHQGRLFKQPRGSYVACASLVYQVSTGTQSDTSSTRARPIPGGVHSFAAGVSWTRDIKGKSLVTEARHPFARQVSSSTFTAWFGGQNLGRNVGRVCQVVALALGSPDIRGPCDGDGYSLCLRYDVAISLGIFYSL